MKRYFRKSMPFFSIVLVMLAGLYLALPHDVCISKLVASNACVCAPPTESDGACCCCGPEAGVLACGDHAKADSHHSEKTDPAGSSCFSISSDQSHMTGAERANNPAPMLAVLAILPLPLEVAVGSESIVASEHQNDAIRDQLDLHRDNCVYLI